MTNGRGSEQRTVSGKELCVRDVMTNDVVTVNRTDKLTVADDVMRLGRIRHMPVVDEEGELCGLVTQRDLFHSALLRALGYGTRAKEQALDAFFVKDAMVAPVKSVSPDAPLSEAASRMQREKIGCLVVVDDEGRIAGILTEGDFLKLATRG